MTKFFMNNAQRISELYQVALVDTCAFSLYLESNGCRRDGNFDEKFNYYLMQAKSYSYWKEIFSEFGGDIFHTTNPIFEELHSGLDKKPSFGKLKKLKNGKKQRSFPHSKGIKDYEQIIQSARGRKKDLVRVIQEKEAILNFNPVESGVYKELFENNLELAVQGDKSLSDTDYNLLISGFVLSQTRGRTAIISNDSGICLAWKDLINNYPRALNMKLDFYYRLKEDSFKFIPVR